MRIFYTNWNITRSPPEFTSGNAIVVNEVGAFERRSAPFTLPLWAPPQLNPQRNRPMSEWAEAVIDARADLLRRLVDHATEATELVFVFRGMGEIVGWAAFDTLPSCTEHLSRAADKVTGFTPPPVMTLRVSGRGLPKGSPKGEFRFRCTPAGIMQFQQLNDRILRALDAPGGST